MRSARALSRVVTQFAFDGADDQLLCCRPGPAAAVGQGSQGVWCCDREGDVGDMGGG